MGVYACIRVLCVWVCTGFSVSMGVYKFLGVYGYLWVFMGFMVVYGYLWVLMGVYWYL